MGRRPALLFLSFVNRSPSYVALKVSKSNMRVMFSIGFPILTSLSLLLSCSNSPVLFAVRNAVSLFIAFFFYVLHIQQKTYQNSINYLIFKYLIYRSPLKIMLVELLFSPLPFLSAALSSVYMLPPVLVLLHSDEPLLFLLLSILLYD